MAGAEQRSQTKLLHFGKKILLFLIVHFCLRQGTAVRLAGPRIGVYTTFSRRSLDQISDASQWMSCRHFHIIGSFIFSSLTVNIHYSCLDCYTLKFFRSFYVQIVSASIKLVCSHVSHSLTLFRRRSEMSFMETVTQLICF